MPDATSMVAAFGYMLLITATIPTLASFDGFGWAVVPVWLSLAGFSGSVLKNLSTTNDSKKKLEQAVWLIWMTYYALCLVFPFPLHWYDSLAMLSLFLPGTIFANSMMMLYYIMTAHAYMGAENALQVAGRLLVATTFATAPHTNLNKPTKDS